MWKEAFEMGESLWKKLESMKERIFHLEAQNKIAM